MRFSVRHRGDTTKGEITTYDIAIEVQDAPYSAREINQPSWTLDGDVTAHWNGSLVHLPGARAARRAGRDREAHRHRTVAPRVAHVVQSISP